MNKYLSNFKLLILLRLWKNFEDVSWNFNEICGEMRRTFVQIFKHIFMEILYYFYVSVWKNFGDYWYRYTYRYFSHH